MFLKDIALISLSICETDITVGCACEELRVLSAVVEEELVPPGSISSACNWLLEATRCQGLPLYVQASPTSLLFSRGLLLDASILVNVVQSEVPHT